MSRRNIVIACCHGAGDTQLRMLLSAGQLKGKFSFDLCLGFDDINRFILILRLKKFTLLPSIYDDLS